MIDRMRSSFAPRAAVFAALLLLAAALGAQAPAAPGTQTPAAQRQEQAPFARNQEWKTYSFPADGFSASYPSEPAMQKKNISTDAGSFELRAYLAEDPPAVMFIGVCDYGAAVAGRNPETVLEGAQKGAIANVSGHLVSGKRSRSASTPAWRSRPKMRPCTSQRAPTWWVLLSTRRYWPTPSASHTKAPRAFSTHFS